MSQALKEVREELYAYAERSITTYYTGITRQAGTTPAAARAYEQAELIRYQLDVRDEAQRKYTEAFERDHVAYPGLLWTEEIESNLKDPVFKYCDVLATVGPEGAPGSGKGFKAADPDVNPQKYSYGLSIGTVAAGVLSKGAAALLATKSIEATALSSVLSVTGTVLIVSGVVLGAYTLFRNGSQVPASQVVGKENHPAQGDASRYMDLEKLMKAQQDYNLQVMRQWLDDLYRLAEAAEQKKAGENEGGSI